MLLRWFDEAKQVKKKEVKKVVSKKFQKKFHLNISFIELLEKMKNSLIY